MTINFLALAAPAIGKATPEIIKLIKNRVSPGEIQQAILAGIKAASAEDEKLSPEQHLFYLSKPDSFQGVTGFLGKYFQVAGIQGELAKSFNDVGKPNVDYLIAEFKRIADEYPEVNPVASSIKPWLTNFVEAYFQATSTFLKFQVAKEDYFAQLNKRYDNIKFAGIAVSGQEEVKQLQQIFVMPDVVRIDRNEEPLLTEFIDPDLPQQQKLILEQRQLSRLSNNSQISLLANKLLTETRTKKAMILGAPGSGKSTLVSYFAVMLTQGKAKDLGLNGDTDWLPIVIEIRDLEQNLDLNIFEYLHQFAESNLTTDKLPPDFYQHWLKQGNAVILLDGIDEVADTAKRYRVVEKLNLFLHQYQDNIAIVTSRPSGYKKDFFSTTEFPLYQLQPFDDEKIEEFINHWYDSRYTDPQEAARCKDTLRKALEDNDRIKQLAKNPLLITIIALIHRYQAYLPKERHKLYDRAVETLLTSWDANKAISRYKVLKYLDLDDLRRLLESLARWIHSQGSTGDKEGGTQIDKDDLLEWLSKYIKINKQKQLHEARKEAERFLNFIRERTGLLNEQGTNRYAFVHKTFQEYLCAQDINYEADDEDDFEIVLNCIKDNLHVAHWGEVLLLLVAQQKPQKALKAIKAIYENNSEYEQWLHRDLLFAGACLVDSPKGTKIKDKDGLSSKVIQNLIGLEIEDNVKTGNKIHHKVSLVITSLSETEWEETALNLLQEKKDKIEQFRLIKYQAALGDKKQSIRLILSMIKRDESKIKDIIFSTLCNIGKGEPEVTNVLLDLLQDKDSIIRFQAASALSKIGHNKPEVINVLLDLLQDKNLKIHSLANVLGKAIQNKSEVINVLLNLLQDKDSEIRFNIVNILGEAKKNKPEIIKVLLNLLQDKDPNIRSIASKVLGDISSGESEVITALLGLLQDDIQLVRSVVGNALGKIGQGNSKVITTLLSLLYDKNPRIILSAINVLIKIKVGESEAIKVLLSLLQDDDYQVRYRAISFLGDLGKDKPEVINALLPLLQHKDSKIQIRAIEALSKIGQNEDKAISSLLSLLQHKDSEVRYRVIDALGEIGQDERKVITVLLSLLKDTDIQERCGVIDALWKIGKSEHKVITTFLSLLQDENNWVSSYAAYGLEQVGKVEPEVIYLVQKWLKQHQDKKYIGNGVDLLWNLVTEDA